MAKTMKEMLAEKAKAKAAGANNNAKPQVGKNAKKPTAADEDDSADEEDQTEGDEGEGEEEEAPAPKKNAKAPVKAPAKKVAPAAEEEEESEDESEEGEGEEEEEAEEEAPAPKKNAKAPVKPAAKAPAKKVVAQEEEEESEDESEEGEGEEEEAEEEAPAPKKSVKAPVKAPVKAAAPAAKAPAAKAPANAKASTTPLAGKKSAWGAKKDVKESRELKQGAWMPLDMFIDHLHGRLEAKDLAPPTKAVTAAVFKEIEATMLDVLQAHDLKFLGVKSRRRSMEPRVYAPNPGLDKVATPYHTLVSPHTKVSFSLYFDKAVSRGMVDESGEFHEGQFDDEGNFVAGTWDTEGNFFPAASATKKKKK
jgi:hypothetical protein